jgi:hypothetical protein
MTVVAERCDHDLFGPLHTVTVPVPRWLASGVTVREPAREKAMIRQADRTSGPGGKTLNSRTMVSEIACRAAPTCCRGLSEAAQGHAHQRRGIPGEGGGRPMVELWQKRGTNIATGVVEGLDRGEIACRATPTCCRGLGEAAHC